MKATVTIDLPDGWELADTKMRKAKPGEYRWLPAVGKPYRLESASEGECFIVRRIATEYVNVKLRREDVKELLHYSFSGRMIKTMREACSEALRERCGRILTLPPHTGAWDTRYDCTREPGHAGEHGV